MEAVGDKTNALFSIKANEARFGFSIDGAEPQRVVRFSGSEAISELFNYSIQIADEDDQLEFSDIVGKPACLTVLGVDDSDPRYMSGIISAIRQVEHGRRFTLYDIELVPHVWRLKLTTDSRIFQDLSTPDIIQSVLTDAGIAGDQFSINVQANYEMREYCVQYQESDWNFISRLMEAEGIFYFFRHTENKLEMVIADNASIHEEIASPATLFHFDGTGLVPDFNHVEHFYFKEQVRTGSVTMRDFDFKKPALSLEASSAAEKETELEVYEYPGYYIQPSDGERIAKVRIEELQSLREIGEGAADCQRLLPGFLFTLEDNPRDSFNQEYLLTRVSHSGTQPQVLEEGASGEASRYKAKFQCIPSKNPFRPQRRAVQTRVKGLQTAIVVGPSGEEIYTDEHGRVKVQFHWDRLGERNEKSSCWIRVAQLWAGAGWGSIYIPRIDQEVVVDFIEGDPDRPMIVGRVYHGTNKPPYALPDEKTKSTIKSNSSIGGEGFNEFRFEDLKGEEEIYLQAEKDWNTLVKNDHSRDVQHDETLHVGNDRNKSVDNDQTETIGANKTISVGKNHSESIGENETISVGDNEDITIGKNRSLSVGENQTISIGKNHSEQIAKNSSLSIGDNQTIDVGKDFKITIGKNLKQSIGDTGKIDFGKDLQIMVGKKTVIDVGDQLTLKCGSASIILKKDGKIQIKGKDINIKGSGNVKIKGSKIAEN